jgi:hypothetical protein
MAKGRIGDTPQGISYHLSKCCNPQKGDEIIGYFREDRIFSVHQVGCSNVKTIPKERLVEITWEEIEGQKDKEPIDGLLYELEELDFRILHHFEVYGLDYAYPISQKTGIGLQETFRRLRRLRGLGTIARVPKVMIQYRKGIVDGKWIKHRNHTYYDLTPLGEKMIAYRGKTRGES